MTRITSRFKSGAPALVAAVAAIAIAGCGDSGDSSSATASTTSSASSQPADQLVEQADAICTSANDKRPPPPQLSAKPSKAELAKAAGYLQTDLEVTTDTYTQLSELAPPEGLEKEWSGVLAGFKKGVIDIYPDLIDAAKAGDLKAFRDAIEQIQGRTARLPQDAAAVGLQVCATAG